MSEPAESRHRVNGVELCLFEWGAGRRGEGPTLFFAHATSFHARCWDRVIARLPGRHVYAVDMRGHGRSEQPPPPYIWRAFGEDVTELARQLDLRGAVAIGHSSGGHAVTLAAALEPQRFSALLLIDPVIPHREAYRRRAERPGPDASRRRNEWASPDEMFDSFKDRPPFSQWDPEVLRDYCDYGLMPAPGGDGFVLACPPEIEAATYAGSSGSDIYDEIATITAPVRVIRAREPEGERQGFGTSPTAPDLASHFPNAEDVYLPDATHYIPMESPDLVARHVEEMLAMVEER